MHSDYLMILFINKHLTQVLLHLLLGTSSHLTASANGVIVDSQPVVKKRRGRRKNVEGVDVLFMNRNKQPNHVSKRDFVSKK